MSELLIYRCKEVINLKQNWNINSIPDLTGKNAIITGANSGLGLETAKIFAQKGAHVILAVRNVDKGEQARKSILESVSNANVEIMKLDLSDLSSVREFSVQYKEKYSTLDLLINNAGVMMPPFQKTIDGFEMQFGSNHLGHFALTGLLLETLLNTNSSRVVTLSSIAHKGANILFDNLDGEKGYNPFTFYGQSKLANLLFSYELNNRLKEKNANTVSVACHPGISSTNLFSFGKKETPWYAKIFLKFVAQPPMMGAFPTLFSATSDNIIGGEYVGPDGAGNRKGNPAIDHSVKNLYNDETLKKLWSVSEELTGITYNFDN